MSNARLTLRVGHRYRRRLPFRRHKPECEEKVEEMMKDLEKRGDLSTVYTIIRLLENASDAHLFTSCDQCVATTHPLETLPEGVKEALRIF